MKCEQPVVSFMNLPVETDLAKFCSDFAIIGARYGVPYGPARMHSDASNAPDATRRVSQRYSNQVDHFDFDLNGSLLSDTNINVVDCGNIPGTLNVSSNASSVTMGVNLILSQGGIPLILGGDDSIPALCVRAYENFGPVNILQIDAHIDYRDEVNGEKNGYSSTIRRIREFPWVNKIVQVGARGTGSARIEDVRDALAAGNIIVTAEQIHEEGVQAATRHFDDSAPWFVTFDVDGLDALVAPGTGVPLPGGLSFHQARMMLNYICRERRFAGIDFVEHFPSLDVRDMTSLAVVRLLTNIIGTTARTRAR